MTVWYRPTTRGEVDARTEDWHRRKDSSLLKSLPAWLGWTDAEYKNYVENGVIPDEEKPEND
jgi:hypothetical protein